MKILNFNYTDAKGKQSARVLLPTSLPSTYFSGTDITELDDEQQAIYVAKREALHEEYVAKIAALDAASDLRYRFRQFKAENVTNIVSEEL